jgi:hypothetical protein
VIGWRRQAHVIPTSGVGREIRIAWGLLLAQFTILFILAFALPKRLEQMPWVLPLVRFWEQWAPNIPRMARWSPDPELTRAFLSIGLTLTVAAGVVGMLQLRGRWGYVEFHSWREKARVLGAGLAIFFAIVVIYCAPGLFDEPPGSSRDAHWRVALSGRVGLAISLNLVPCAGQLFFLLCFWLALREPVQP